MFLVRITNLIYSDFEMEVDSNNRHVYTSEVGMQEVVRNARGQEKEKTKIKPMAMKKEMVKMEKIREYLWLCVSLHCFCMEFVRMFELARTFSLLPTIPAHSLPALHLLALLTE